MIDLHDDDELFDRLHAAADAVPASTLDLPVVLLRSRRKSAMRRVVTGTATLTAVAVVTVGVASGLPGRVAPDLVPAASSETLTTEIVHREVAPGITAVTQAATYELTDQRVVLDTGIETGAHGDRFLIVSTAVTYAGGPVETMEVGIDPGTGQVIEVETGEGDESVPDPKDPAYVQEMADLGYAPFEESYVQVVAGNEAELRRLRDGTQPTTVVVESLGSMATVEVAGERLVFGAGTAGASEGARGESDTYVTSWDPFEGADGKASWALLVPTLDIPDGSWEFVALEVAESVSFTPQMAITFGHESQAAGGCSRPDSGCTVAYDPQTRVATPSNEVDPRWEAPVDPVQIEMSTVNRRYDGYAAIYRCLERRGAVDDLVLADLSANRQDLLVDDRETMVRCIADDHANFQNELGLMEP